MLVLEQGWGEAARTNTVWIQLTTRSIEIKLNIAIQYLKTVPFLAKTNMVPEAFSGSTTRTLSLEV